MAELGVREVSVPCWTGLRCAITALVRGTARINGYLLLPGVPLPFKLAGPDARRLVLSFQAPTGIEVEIKETGTASSPPSRRLFVPCREPEPTTRTTGASS